MSDNLNGVRNKAFTDVVDKMKKKILISDEEESLILASLIGENY
jgi:hypothetical protein